MNFNFVFPYEQISGESEAVKKALFAISAIMYKFSPREDIPLETTVPEAPPSIIIPSDVPIYPPGGLYPNADPILPSRSVPSILGAARVPDLQGYADTGNTWPVYSTGLSLVSGLVGASQSEELVIRVLCPFNKIGRVIGKGGGTIKSIRQASGAQIDVDDTKDNRDECVITVTAIEVWVSVFIPFVSNLLISIQSRWSRRLTNSTSNSVVDLCFLVGKYFIATFHDVTISENIVLI